MNKELNILLKEVTVLERAGRRQDYVARVVFDSRKVGKGDLFVAVPGTQTDGHNHIPQALEKGAAAVICQQIPDHASGEADWIRVEDSAEALALVAAAYYDHPAKKLTLAGITGTNGKTTTVTLLHQLFRAMGHKAGMLSTVKVVINDQPQPAAYTTPDPLTVNNTLQQMVKAGCRYAFMEVSSHALVQKRVHGLPFQLAMFSNITHDHLDYHKTFDAYIEAKKQFFDLLKPQAKALVNLDDRNALRMMQNTPASKHSCALQKMAEFKGRVMENTLEGIQMEVDGREVWSPLAGKFNACNLLMVYAAARLLGKEKEETLLNLSTLRPAEGRFQIIRSAKGQTAVVDYAHTPDALENVAKTISDLKPPGQQFVIVLGAGGDRDKQKRPLMAKIAEKYADVIIFTSDNPRSEDPNDIIDQMKNGLTHTANRKILEITDRKQAIRTACMLAQNKDIILVAGKGHENYQEINGERKHFDDKEIIGSCFKDQ